MRLLTLTGSGGIGKTRLAVETARRAAQLFPDGIIWVPLETLRDPRLVMSRLAQALDVKEDPTRPLADSLAADLAGKRSLILLDNAEHLLPQCASDVAWLLEACPSVSLLVTSRERLQLAGEHVYSVPSLSESEAVALFVRHAQSLDPGFVETPAALELCRRLDLLPLALELAAARTLLFVPEQLLERLSQRLDLLKAGRGADPRHQTLRATLEWSYDLLSDVERRLFARLSVFAGGCTIEAAEEVCGADPDLVQSLLEKSLLRRSHAEGRVPRFSMLETVREFSAERLRATDDEPDVLGGHARYFLELAQVAARGVAGGEDQATHLHRLEAEHDNLRVAVRWSSTADDMELQLRLAVALGVLWDVQGRLSEARQHLQDALRRAQREASLPRLAALINVTTLAARMGDYRAASDWSEEGLSVARQLGDDQLLARLLTNLGVVTSEGLGDLERARSFEEEALSVYRGLGDARGIAHATGNLGYLELLQGNYSRAEELLAESEGQWREQGNLRHVTTLLLNLALVALERGERTLCVARAKEGLETAAELGFQEGIWKSFEILAAAASDPDRSAVLLGAASTVREAEGASAAPFALETVVRERTIAGVRRQLGEAYQAHWDRGEALAIDEAVAHALSDNVAVQGPLAGT